ncbi:hypothetical protein HmCmsJML265_04729 [Escherichia coli]|jgi:hypothetical protein|nr:hypothetical protein HmCmsJML022_03500 [Escherichia coli]GCZ16605.1 hypothetical protein HmCmsJML173_04872 [Escherichia coli]GDD49299.1 hypothetical protein HmCmsJML265_04729 [Escherichia coli]
MVVKLVIFFDQLVLIYKKINNAEWDCENNTKKHIYNVKSINPIGV